ncbi:GntR family transcriptional regulator [Amycolatopsis palatopharyngis]|uniref:GntR family transcriptional regulator n=1 Tax=Amycolatopsis palatopharyngis TaxID=187982 RepID=UPI0013BE93D6|nr:GntR family transcriptional regulator [Amycolatopsis palatopharyngis]
MTQHVGTQAYERLKQAIIDCSIEPGALLSDRHLSEQLGVSRTPVRDALRQLESTGLVVRRGRVGWAVSGLDAKDVAEVFELRRLLEPAGLFRMVKWDRERLAWFVSLFDEFTTPMDPERIARYLKVDDYFHRTIVAAAENRRLTQAYEIVCVQLDRFRHFTSYRYHGRVDQSLSEHRMVCEALSRGDAEEAARSLVAHISSAEEKLTAIVQGTVTDPTLAQANPKEAE